MRLMTCICRLKPICKKLHNKVKNHEPKILGKIVRLIDNQTYGFIEAIDGTEYYFSADSVVHPQFDQLAVGDEVHFIEYLGKEGFAGSSC